MAEPVPMRPKKVKARPTPVKFKISGVEIDFAKVVPMVAGDWTALKRQGVKLGPNNNLLDDPDAMVEFVLWFAQKVQPAITREAVLEVPIHRVMRAVQFIHAASEDFDEDPN